MKINYEYTKDDYKKFLIKNRIINNVVLFIIGVIIYLYFSYNKISLVYLPLYIIGLIFVIVMLNLLYIWASFKANDILNYNLYGKFILELTPNKFSLTINKVKTDYKYKQIKKVIEKKYFSNNEYLKVIEMFKEKIKSKK